MFNRFSKTNRMLPLLDDGHIIREFEFVIEDSSVLKIRPLFAELSPGSLEELVECLVAVDSRLFPLIHLDFTNVVELSGAWSIHFALLIWLVRRSASRVEVTGLHGQPAAVALLLRNSPEIRKLVDPRQRTAAQIANAA